MNDVSFFLGIDFGTSKCVMSWYNPEKQQAEILLNNRDERETPSLVYIGQSNLLVGNAALDKLENEGASSERFVSSVKRNLRAGWRQESVDGTIYEPTDIAAAVFRELKQDAEKRYFHGETLTRAVITYPASFDVLQQGAIEKAASKAGFKDIKLLSEPEAAALACKYTDLHVGECLLIYDFGAGTFDVAVVSKKKSGAFSLVMKPDGLEKCGGDDLDRQLYAYCDEIAKKELGRSISLNKDLLDMNFLRICRKRKENLSREQEQVFSDYLANVEGKPRIRFSHRVTRAAFEDRITPYVKRTVELTQKMLRQAEQKGTPVDKIILIGGSSQIPLIRSSLVSATQVSVLEWQQNQGDFRDFAVALGAAYHGHSVWGSPQVQSSTNKKTAPRQKVQSQTRPTIVPIPKMPEANQPQPKKPELTPVLKTPTPSAHPTPLAPPTPAQVSIARPASAPISSASSVSSITAPQRSVDGAYLSPRPQRNVFTVLFSLCFLLLFSSLAVAEFFNKASVFISPLPYIGETTLHWPVMGVFAILSLLLFGRFPLAKFLNFCFLLLFGGTTFLLFRGMLSLDIASSWINVSITWQMMAVLTGLALVLFLFKLAGK